MTYRVGTVAVAGAASGSVGLWWVHGAFLLLTFAIFGFWVMAAGISRTEAFSDIRRAQPWTLGEPNLVWFPIGCRVVRHNERVRPRRRIANLMSGISACEALIRDCREPHEQTRILVLEAERDAAKRQYVRLEEDLSRLEASWVREDREREFKRLTGGRG